jgi:hypothetical protein
MRLFNKKGQTWTVCAAVDQGVFAARWRTWRQTGL